MCFSTIVAPLYSALAKLHPCNCPRGNFDLLFAATPQVFRISYCEPFCIGRRHLREVLDSCSKYIFNGVLSFVCFHVILRFFVSFLFCL